MSSRVAAGVGKKRQRHSRGTGSNAAGSEVGAPGGSDAAADEEPTTPAAAANTAAAPAELPPAIDIDAAAVTAQAGASQSASPSGHRAAKQRKLAHDDAGGESVAGSPAKQESPTPAPATPAGASAPTAVVVGTPVSEAGGVVSASPQSSAGASPVGSPNASGSPVTPTTPAATNAATDAAATTNTTSTTTTASAAASAAAPSASPALPSLPAGMNRGYYAQFYWASHYAPYESVPLSTPLPTFTEVVASIPAIFHQIVSVLQTVEYATRKRDVLVELDKKIVKTMSSKEVDLVPTLDRKLLLRSQACNQDYMIHACRKEHVRLIFASADDGGVLGKLALCPLLIDLFLVQQGGKRSLAGGSGGYRYAASAAGAGSAGAGGKRASGGAAASPTATNVPEKGFDYKCACGHTEKDDLPTAVSSSDPTSVKLESDAASPTAGRTIKSEVGESKVEDFDMADASPEAPHAQASPRATAPSLSPVPSSQRRVPGSGSDKSSLLRSPPSSGSGHPHGTSSSAGAAAAAADHSSHGGAGCINCASWSKKHAKQAKIIEKMKLELQAVHDERGLWEQKWCDERDHNIRLWEKTLLIQKQLRDMSRPLSVSLGHAMNHISTTTPPNQTQAQMANATAATPAQPQTTGVQHQQQQAQQQQQQQQQHLVQPPSSNGYSYGPVDVSSGLVSVDPYQSGVVVSPLTDAQLQQHLHPSELQSTYPSNIQNQLAQARILQQQQQQQAAAVSQSQSQQVPVGPQ